jgi:uncharacterized protein (UPF0335 family)
MTDNVSSPQLKQYVERAERLIEERKGISDDLKDVFLEAKSQGFDVPTIKWAIKQRAIDKAKRQEVEALQETYQLALGF